MNQENAATTAEHLRNSAAKAVEAAALIERGQLGHALHCIEQADVLLHDARSRVREELKRRADVRKR